MGVVAGVFMQSGGGMWPRADKSNELYALDRLHYMREVMGKYDEILAGVGPMQMEDHSHEEGGSKHEH